MTALLARRQRWRDPDRGLSTSAEVVLIVPLLVVLLGVIVGGGKYWYAWSTVERAANSAARSATLSRSMSAAEADAREVAGSELRSAGVTCASQSVRVDTSRFTDPLGEHAEVTVTVDCVLSFGDLIVPGWPGTVTATHSASSVLDLYRGRLR